MAGPGHRLVRSLLMQYHRQWINRWGAHQGIMFESILRENPLLAGIVGAVVLALALLLGGALVSNLVDRRRRRYAIRSVPDQGSQADWDESYANTTQRQRGSGRAARAGFGVGALAVAFLIGAVAGGVGITVWSRDVASAVGALAELMGPGSASDPEAGSGIAKPKLPPGNAALAATEPESDVLAQLGEVTREEVNEKLATFVQKLNSSLPREAGPELSLTRADLDGMRLHLGYAVGREMAADETQAFDAYIMRTAKSLFCGRESREIRFLSQNGVVFDMEYTDPKGRTVSKLTVNRDFCA